MTNKILPGSNSFFFKADQYQYPIYSKPPVYTNGVNRILIKTSFSGSRLHSYKHLINKIKIEILCSGDAIF